VETNVIQHNIAIYIFLFTIYIIPATKEYEIRMLTWRFNSIITGIRGVRGIRCGKFEPLAFRFQ
jgi:hypothetical protein